MNHTTLALLTVLACSATAADAVSASAQANEVQAQVDKLGFLTGDWACSGKVFAHGSVTAHPTTAQAHGAKVVDGHWILFRYDEDKTAENPRPFHIDQYLGYDSATRRFVSVALDTVGYFSETTPDLSGDSITFDETDAGKVVGHDTFARTNPDEISHTGRNLDKAGNWIKTDTEVCHRVR